MALDENEQPVTGGALLLSRQEITFGSDPRRATQVLESDTIDGLHARLYRGQGDLFYLADQGSVAGTWVNYSPVPQGGTRLEHGDLIHIGRIGFRFMLRKATSTRKPIIISEPGPDDFIGHIGGDDFILITTQDRAAALAEAVRQRFNQEIGSHYSFKDRGRGYTVANEADGTERHVPLMKLCVGVVLARDYEFTDIREITEVSAEQRRKACS